MPNNARQRSVLPEKNMRDIAAIANAINAKSVSTIDAVLAASLEKS